MRRSSIIESKRTSLVSKCIAKNDVPEDPTLHHTPCNSFDSNGVLLQEAWLAEDHEELVTTIAPPAVPPTTKSPASISILPNLIENISIRIHNELINTTVYGIAKEIAVQVAIQNAKVQTTHRIFKQCLDDFVRYNNYGISMLLYVFVFFCSFCLSGLLIYLFFFFQPLAIFARNLSAKYYLKCKLQNFKSNIN